ncbi:MAG: hypothetical protein CMQ21_14325 [Gammaproteobacteria bacterium]|nr:hypothetical protein [Gammaproteobacteria bacterium]
MDELTVSEQLERLAVRYSHADDSSDDVKNIVRQQIVELPQPATERLITAFPRTVKAGIIPKSLK